MTHLAIIADDLSSATDCGAQVARCGQSVIVPLRGHTLPRQAHQAAVISIDTHSRNASSERAYAAVKEATEALAAGGWRHFYKSVDSTLRGNIGVELEAVLDVTRPDCAIIAPAFPNYGRTTQGGVQFLNGLPLNETEFGTDPTAPVREANLIRLLAQGSHRKAGYMPLSSLRQGRSQVSAQLERLLADGVELVVFDVQSQDDLARVCTHVAASGVRVVWVGSTGLAEFVPLALGLKGSGQPKSDVVKRLDRHPVPHPAPHPALVVAGSASETTRHQLLYAQSTAGLRLVTVDLAPIMAGGEAADSETHRVLAALHAAVREGHDAGLAVSSSREEIAATQALGAGLGLSPLQVAQRVVEVLARVCWNMVTGGGLSGIVATGGDTAKAICDILQVEAIEIVGEVEAGIPVMTLIGPTALPMVTKAGGFGSISAIARSIEMVKQHA